ncbi:MAG: DinB family protein [Anaerolineales bacterium]|nr:DinB family protein [Anaerolineales bacterium]
MDTRFDCDVKRSRANLIGLMQNTLKILGYFVDGTTQEVATTRRDPNDGDKGWTLLEVVCHLRDFDAIFYGRTRLMVEQDYPSLAPYDHEQLAIRRAYNQQDLRQVYQELVRSRHEFIEFFRSLDEAQWQRCGVHAERGRFTMHDALVQVGQHDALHIEQITRILTQSQAW